MKPHTVPLLLAAFFIGCREPPTPPSQQSVDQAWQRTDHAAQQVADAEQQTRNARRLRDIDRMRFQAQSVELRERLAVTQGLLAALTAALLATMLWLGLEIRPHGIGSASVSISSQGRLTPLATMDNFALP